MALNYVTLVLNLYDGSGNPETEGTATLVPSAVLTDASGRQIVDQDPIPVVFQSGVIAQVTLLATDNAGVLPTGWNWAITFAGQAAPIAGFSFVLPANPMTFTATGGSPCVLTGSGTTYPNGTGVQLSGVSLLTGLENGVTYYVVNASGSTFQLATTAGGAGVASLLAGSGSMIAVQQYLSNLVPATSGTPGGIYVPTVQSFPLANDAYASILQWTVTEQTDSPLPPFNLLATSATLSSAVYPGMPIQGPAFFFGYNVDLLGGQVASSAHGAAGLSCFADAGDSNNNAGGHGIEFNPASFTTADGTKSTNAFQMVGIDDDTNTVNTTIRCGTGTSGGYTSNIYFQTGSTVFAEMRAATGQTNFQAPVTFSGGIAGPLTQSITGAVWNAFTSTGGAVVFTLSAQGAASAAQFSILSNTGTATMILSGNSSSTVDGEIIFEAGGTPRWAWVHEDPYLILTDWVSSAGAPHLYFIPGADYATAQTLFLSQVQVYNSLIVNNGGSALATTATNGFLYLPACAGTPTGVPAPQTGSVASVYDTVDNKIYIYNGTWKAVSLS